MKRLYTQGRKKKILSFILIGIVGISLAGLAFYQVFFRRPEYVIVRIKGSPGNWWWVTPRPPDWLAFSIKKGDKEYDAVNRPTAEVLSVDVYDSGGSSRDVYLLVKLEVRHNPRTNQYRYKGEPLEVGGPISLSLNGKFFPGMVTENFGAHVPTRTYVDKTVVVRHKSRLPYEYDSIVIGDTIQDGEGTAITEIIDKSRAPALDKEINITEERIVSSDSPREDFYVTVKMKVQERRGELVYREEQYIKVGSFVWLMFPRYNISEADVISIK